MSKPEAIGDRVIGWLAPYMFGALLLAGSWAVSAFLRDAGIPHTVQGWIRCTILGLVALFLGLLGVIMFIVGMERDRKSLQDQRSSAAQAEERREADRRRADLEQEVAALAAAGPHALTTEECENARSLLMLATADSLRLACLALDASDMTVHDVAAVFTPEVLQRLALATLEHPDSWPELLRIVRDAGPCVRLFAMHVCSRLRHRDAFHTVGGGKWETWTEADPIWKPLLQIVLVNELPDEFMVLLSPFIVKVLASRVERQDEPHHYLEYAFPFESLTTLSDGGARVLAGVPHSELPRHHSPPGPMWEAYGRHLTLYRIKRLSDEAAATLSRARREILFGGLEQFPDSPGHVQLAQRLACQRHIVLGSPTHLSPVIAGLLSAATVSPPSALPRILGCRSQADRDRVRSRPYNGKYGLWEPDIPDNLY